MDIILQKVGKALIWVSATAFIGFLQVMAFYVIALLDETKGFELIMVYEKGFILFFALAIVTTVLIDYELSGPQRSLPILVRLSFLLLPIALIISCILAYAVIVLGTIDIKNLVIFENILLAFAVLFATLLKSLVYLSEVPSRN